MKKIAFFDIDGTLTSEIDGSIPVSAIEAIRAARANGNLMFINTGRCFQNVEERFRSIGFDGLVCGCGTNIYCEDREILHVSQTHDVTMELLKAAQVFAIMKLCGFMIRLTASMSSLYNCALYISRLRSTRLCASSTRKM